MNEIYFSTITWAWLLFAIALVPIQLRITAPYGRHSRTTWGLMIGNRLGWTLMEVVSLLVFCVFFLLGTAEKSPGTWVLFALWTAHYAHRSLIYPWRTHTLGKKMPLFIVFSAVFFNSVNGFLNGWQLGELQIAPPEINQPRFLFGLVVFLAGAILNLYADSVLLRLRKPGETDYKIPQNRIFRQVSCPNLLGEIIEWAGFAIMAWNLPALSFAVWTAANLIPRALSHHRWYKEQFEDYPIERKAVIPFVL